MDKQTGITIQWATHACVRAKSLQSCLPLCNLMDCSLPVHEILQSRTLEWVPCPPPEDLPDPRMEPTVLWLLHCRQILYHWATRETLDYPYSAIKRNEALIHATTWMNLKCILLDERSQIPKKYMSCDSIYMAFWERQNCGDGSMLAWAEDGGGIDYQGVGGNCEEKWKCSVSWLCWRLRDCVHLSKFFLSLFLAALGLRCCAWGFSSCRE